MKLQKYTRLFFIVLVILAVVAVVSTNALGDDGHGHDHGGGDTDVTIGGTNVDIGETMLSGGDTSVSTGGNKAFAFAYGMGDVDINEGKNCMGSEQWGTVIVGRQTMELNAWCASLFYELNGRHEFAAKMRCDIKEVRKKYQADEECWADQDLSPIEPEIGVTGAIVMGHNEDIQIVQAQLSEVQMELDDLKKRPAPRPRVVQAAPPPEPEMSLAEKEAIIAMLYGDEDE